MSLNALIGALRVDLLIDSAAFKKGAAEAQHSFSGLQRDMARVGKNIQGIGENLSLKITAPLLAVGVAVGAATQSLTGLKDQAVLAKMGTQEFKTLAIAAGSFGVEQEQLSGILKDVNERVGEFVQTGGGPMADFFENIAPKVGITADNFRDLSGADALQLYVTSLEKANLSQEEMTFYMNAMSGDASKLLPVFTKNGKVLQEVTDRAKELGLAIDDDLIESARVAAQDFAIVKEVMGVEMQEALVRLAPAFQSLGKAIVPVVENIAKGVASAAEAFSALSPETQGFIVAAAGIAAALGPALVVLGAAVGGIAALISPIGLVVVGLAALAAGAVYLYQNWAEISSWAMSFEPVRFAVEQLKFQFDSLVWTVQTGLTLVQGVISAFVQIARDGFSLVTNLLNGDWAAAWQSAQELSDGVLTAINAMLLGLPQAAIDGIGGLVTALQTEMARLANEYMPDWAKNVIDGFVKGFGLAMDGAKATVTNFGNSVSTWFKETLGIFSPSRVFAGFGDNVVQGLVVGIDRSGDAAVKAIDDLAARMKSAGQSAVDGMVSAFANGLAKGDMAGAVSGAFSGYMSNAQTAFGDVLKTTFGKGGGGFASIGSTISGAFKGIGAAFSGGGGFMAGISGALSSALPLVGMVSSIASLIKSFSSQKTVGAGLNLGVQGGDLVGNQFTKIQKSSFWGLINNTSTKKSLLTAGLASALSAQLASAQDMVRDVYERAGVGVSDAMVDGVSIGLGRINTMGKSQEQIAAQVSAAFARYQDALSMSIGEVGFEAAVLFADVSDVLKVAGQRLTGSFKDMAGAAAELSALFGGVDAMGGLVGRFVDQFFSDAQKLDLVQADVTAAFAKLGLAIPGTMDGFRDLVLGQDLMTKAGQANYAALLNVADAFAYVTQGGAAASAAMQSVSDAFSALDGRYATEFDARLARAGQANGYAVSAGVSAMGAIGNVALAANDKGLAMLTKIYNVLVKPKGKPQGTASDVFGSESHNRHHHCRHQFAHQ